MLSSDCSVSSDWQFELRAGGGACSLKQDIPKDRIDLLLAVSEILLYRSSTDLKIMTLTEQKTFHNQYEIYLAMLMFCFMNKLPTGTSNSPG